MKYMAPILVLLVTLPLAAQAQLRVVPAPEPLAIATPVTASEFLPSLFSAFAESGGSAYPQGAQSPPPLPVAFRMEDLALFCRIEVRLEKATHMPVRFRLGSVDYVDFLEGKRDYLYYVQQ